MSELRALTSLRATFSRKSEKMSFFTQKEHPAPQKLKFRMKKSVVFYWKKAPSLAKKLKWCMKKMKKSDKKCTKKNTHPRKNPEVLHEKLKIVQAIVI